MLLLAFETSAKAASVALFDGEKLVGFGDGYVEVELVANLGGLAIGAATNEETREGINQWKRNRLISAGANAIIPDFRNAEAIIQKIT